MHKGRYVAALLLRCYVTFMSTTTSTIFITNLLWPYKNLQLNLANRLLLKGILFYKLMYVWMDVCNDIVNVIEPQLCE